MDALVREKSDRRPRRIKHFILERLNAF